MKKDFDERIMTVVVISLFICHSKLVAFYDRTPLARYSLSQLTLSLSLPFSLSLLLFLYFLTSFSLSMLYFYCLFSSLFLNCVETPFSFSLTGGERKREKRCGGAYFLSLPLFYLIHSLKSLCFFVCLYSLLSI